MTTKGKKLADLLVAYNEKLFSRVNKGGLEVYENWEKIVGIETKAGKKCAENSELIDIENKKAIIKVFHSGWSNQIMLRKKIILANFKKFYPEFEIKALVVTVSSSFEYKKPQKKHVLSQEEKKILEKEEIKKELPEELKTALKKLKKTMQEKK